MPPSPSPRGIYGARTFLNELERAAAPTRGGQGMIDIDQRPQRLEHARELRLRCVVRPDDAQRRLLDRLGLRLPERIRPPQISAQL